MSEELKPCPFCGKPPTSSNGHIEQTPHFRITCHAEVGCTGSGGEKLIRNMWNSAWVWKELEKKDKLCRELLGKLWFVHAEINCSGDCTTVDLIKRAEEILK